MKDTAQRLEGIDEFATLLGQARGGVSVEDLADIFWLADKIQFQALSKDGEGQPSGVVDKEEGNQQQQQQSSSEGGSQPLHPLTRAGETPTGGLYTGSPSDRGDVESVPEEGIPLKIPAAPALRSRLELGRSLRPLKRKVASRTQESFDEEATVEQIAEQGIWSPVQKPEPERWLTLSLVVEQTVSSVIWEETVAELKHLVERLGIFRRVRAWSFGTGEQGQIQVTPWGTGGRGKRGKPLPAQVLLDTSGRQVIWVLSDCLSAVWQKDALYRQLRKWSENHPVSLVQFLPERLWSRSSLEMGDMVRLKALFPGAPNTKLRSELLLPLFLEEEGEGEKSQEDLSLHLPVVTLEPEPIARWSRVVAGYGDVEIVGVKIQPGFERLVEEESRRGERLRPRDAEYLVRQFHVTASIMAQRLAGLMAAVPVSLPVINLIQQTLLPQSRQVHVAEVLMSELVEMRDQGERYGEVGWVPQYEFVEGVRGLLLETMPTDQVEGVLDAVSVYIAEHLGLGSKSFEALIAEMPSAGFAEQKTLLPFARIASQTLKRMGGYYASIAEQLVKPAASAAAIAVSLGKDWPALYRHEFQIAKIEIEAVEEADLPPEIDPAAFMPPEVDITEQVPPPVPAVGLEVFEFETVKVDAEGREVERRRGTAYQFVEPLSEGEDSVEAGKSKGKPRTPIVLEMVFIPGGSFVMGSSKEEEGHYEDESPQHVVTVAEFFIGKTPITQAQWRVVAGFAPVARDLKLTPSNFKGDTHPVEQVSWDDAVEFCARLSRETGKEYRLPSEAEWEYACRGEREWREGRVEREEGEMGKVYLPYHFGETITPELANYDRNREGTTAVGEYPANGFGLYDMHGNVWEWCEDDWHGNYKGAPRDGKAWVEDKNKRTSNRVLRGGSWYDNPRLCRSAYRYNFSPDYVNYDLGFRVVCVAARTL